MPQELNGLQERLRAPHEGCALDAGDDYAAVQPWLERHESEAMRRAYKKEAERLILWAVVERGVALSSLSTEDATAYRAFLTKEMAVTSGRLLLRWKRLRPCKRSPLSARRWSLQP